MRNMVKKFINAVIYRHPGADEILVEDGKFKVIGTNLGEADEVIDLEGKFVLPPYVDSHLHLDYVYTLSDMAEIGASSGTLFEAIELWPKYKNQRMTIDSVKRLAKKGILDEVSQGTQYIRAQTDVTDPEFKGLKALLELREEMKDIVDIQVVAFPQNGMYAYRTEDGVIGRDLVEEGLKMGADVVGGIPHYEPAREFGEKSVHDIVNLAVKYDKLIDSHTDETDDNQSRFVELLNALAWMEGIGEKTTASHIVSFGTNNDAYAYRMLDWFKKSGINIVSNPTENAYLQGRHDTSNKFRGVTRIKELTEAGVNVSFGQDSINDAWYPMGSGNLMNVLDNGIHLAQTMSHAEVDRAFDYITYNGAKTLHIHNEYGIEEGKRANFIVLDGDSAWDAIRRRVQVLASVRDGEFLFKKKATEFDVALDMDRF